MAAISEKEQLRRALAALLERYTSLVNSGDAGHWDPETEPEVIEARRALNVQTVDMSEVEQRVFRAASGFTPPGDKPLHAHTAEPVPFDHLNEMLRKEREQEPKPVNLMEALRKSLDSLRREP